MLRLGIWLLSPKLAQDVALQLGLILRGLLSKLPCVFELALQSEGPAHDDLTINFGLQVIDVITGPGC